eukprot:jgi/Mesvir1/18595/Mv17104-RA.1
MTKLGDLPQELLNLILEKVPPKEARGISILSKGLHAGFKTEFSGTVHLLEAFKHPFFRRLSSDFNMSEPHAHNLFLVMVLANLYAPTLLESATRVDSKTYLVSSRGPAVDVAFEYMTELMEWLFPAPSDQASTAAVFFLAPAEPELVRAVTSFALPASLSPPIKSLAADGALRLAEFLYSGHGGKGKCTPPSIMTRSMTKLYTAVSCELGYGSAYMPLSLPDRDPEYVSFALDDKGNMWGVFNSTASHPGECGCGSCYRDLLLLVTREGGVYKTKGWGSGNGGILERQLMYLATDPLSCLMGWSQHRRCVFCRGDLYSGCDMVLGYGTACRERYPAFNKLVVAKYATYFPRLFSATSAV